MADMAGAREFYGEVLGLDLVYEKPGELLYKAAKESRIYLYEGQPSVADHTVAYFYVADLAKVMEELSSRGVRFEQYPELKTNENGVAQDDNGIKYAWFKDHEGHVLALAQIK
jgi:catechol 2,3-dioxygenase-like lactoylglutathione lyase family enzyme